MFKASNKCFWPHTTTKKKKFFWGEKVRLVICKELMGHLLDHLDILLSDLLLNVQLLLLVLVPLSFSLLLIISGVRLSQWMIRMMVVLMICLGCQEGLFVRSRCLIFHLKLIIARIYGILCCSIRCCLIFLWVPLSELSPC